MSVSRTWRVAGVWVLLASGGCSSDERGEPKGAQPDAAEPGPDSVDPGPDTAEPGLPCGTLIDAWSVGGKGFDFWPLTAVADDGAV